MHQGALVFMCIQYPGLLREASKLVFSATIRQLVPNARAVSFLRHLLTKVSRLIEKLLKISFLGAFLCSLSLSISQRVLDLSTQFLEVTAGEYPQCYRSESMEARVLL